jgi:hypothetical protein
MNPADCFPRMRPDACWMLPEVGGIKHHYAGCCSREPGRRVCAI